MEKVLDAQTTRINTSKETLNLGIDTKLYLQKAMSYYNSLDEDILLKSLLAAKKILIDLEKLKEDTESLNSDNVIPGTIDKIEKKLMVGKLRVEAIKRTLISDHSHTHDTLGSLVDDSSNYEFSEKYLLQVLFSTWKDFNKIRINQDQNERKTNLKNKFSIYSKSLKNKYGYTDESLKQKLIQINIDDDYRGNISSIYKNNSETTDQGLDSGKIKNVREKFISFTKDINNPKEIISFKNSIRALDLKFSSSDEWSLDNSKKFMKYVNTAIEKIVSVDIVQRDQFIDYLSFLINNYFQLTDENRVGFKVPNTYHPENYVMNDDNVESVPLDSLQEKVENANIGDTNQSTKVEEKINIAPQAPTSNPGVNSKNLTIWQRSPVARFIKSGWNMLFGNKN